MKRLTNPILLNEFGRLVLLKFRHPLSKFGYKRELKKVTDFSCNIIYGNGEKYIKIVANINPRDYPPYFNIVLGEGGRNFFESDWNSIALWRMKRWIKNDPKASEYSLKEPIDLDNLLKTALDDLQTYGISFLSGDMNTFYQVRTDQNKDREPYKIYKPDEVGKYVMHDDPMSLKLKKKYSKSANN